MVDTVVFKQPWKIRPDLPSVLEWEFQKRQSFTPGKMGSSERKWIVAKHAGKQITASGPSLDLITKVTVASLGTMLNGHNGQPPNGQREQDAAMDIVCSFLGQIAIPWGDLHFKRVDICLDLDNCRNHRRNSPPCHDHATEHDVAKTS